MKAFQKPDTILKLLHLDLHVW